MASLRDRVKASKTDSRQPKDTDVAQFIEAASETASLAAEAEMPWEAFDKKAVPRATFNLRLNDYELTLLRWLAERRDESMQKIAKRELIPLLEQLAEAEILR